jgi:N-acetylglucosamine-6-phosphate deacetylase
VNAQVLFNARMLTDAGWVEGQALVLDGGRIKALLPEREARARAGVQRDLGGALLLPGFVDTQVNGGGGVLFNDAPDVESIRTIGAAHRRFGTTSFLPTLISDDLDVLARAIAAVDEAIAVGVPGVAGIHIEGPFISETRKGAHDAAHIRELEPAHVGLLSSLRRGRTLVTLAPEHTTVETIALLARAGVVVAAGHSNASYREIRDALDHGLSGFTHLFNAMSPLQSRAPGVVGAALHDQRSWCGIIVDGWHVDPVVLQIALRAKRLDRFMLVTDAMPIVGSDAEEFQLQGRRILVREGQCIDEQGTLSGSALDMASAVRNAVHMLDVSLEDAIRMASTWPAEFLGLSHELGHIKSGYRANLVLMDDALQVLDTWIDGRGSIS